MTFPKIGLAIAVLALSPLALFMFTHGSAVVSTFSGGTGNRTNTVGSGRDTILGQITKVYVLAGRDVTAGMRQSTALAPVLYLNAELRRRGLNWRVASVKGVTAETFDVS